MGDMFNEISQLWEERLNQLMEEHNISREEAYNMLCEEMDASAKDSNHRVRVRKFVRNDNQPTNE